MSGLTEFSKYTLPGALPPSLSLSLPAPRKKNHFITNWDECNETHLITNSNAIYACVIGSCHTLRCSNKCATDQSEHLCSIIQSFHHPKEVAIDPKLNIRKERKILYNLVDAKADQSIHRVDMHVHSICHAAVKQLKFIKG